jgi:trans-aconitate methyltransferase
MPPEWFDPETLDVRQGVVYRTRADDPEIGGDFGSYAIANRGAGLAESGIGNHNLVYARQRVKLYDIILRGQTLNRIADIGCGLGITTNALACHYHNAEVLGLEISADAVEFAQNNFKRAKFVRTVVAPSIPLPGPFDLILCQEFYPFTRTADLNTHRNYIDYFMGHLSPDGILLIELSERDHEESILATVDQMDLNAEKRSLPFDRIYRNLPLFTPALIVSKILATILSRPENKCVLLRAHEAAHGR